MIARCWSKDEKENSGSRYSCDEVYYETDMWAGNCKAMDGFI